MTAGPQWCGQEPQAAVHLGGHYMLQLPVNRQVMCHDSDLGATQGQGPQQHRFFLKNDHFILKTIFGSMV